jgi:transposase
MLYAQVNAQARETLCAQMKTTKDAKMYRRFKVIDLSGQGYNVADLARLFDISEAAVRRYIHRFNHAGIEGLSSHYGRGRPPTLAWSQAEWLDVLAQSPANLPLLESRTHTWTQALLRLYLKLYHHIEVSQPTIAKSLSNADIRWRRAKLRVYSPAPLYPVKRHMVT